MIYVSHASSFDFRRDLYPAFDHDGIILPHEDGDQPYNILAALNGKQIRKVVAEISYPSTGQGIELGWASMKGVPIFGIYLDWSKPSRSAVSICVATFRYQNFSELKALVEDTLLGPS